MKIQIATKRHIAGLLALQEKYLFTNLSEAEREQGFVTTPFSVPQIEQLLKEKSIFVAVSQGKVVAYTYAGTWAYFSQWAIFPYMESLLPSWKFKNTALTTENTFQYGPVCVDMAYRGSGLFEQIFEAMRTKMHERFPIGITFINQVNQPSYKAHTKKLGLTVMDTFSFNERNYYALAFDTAKP
jgi:hypothetical protein